MSIKQINDTTFSADGLGDVKPIVTIGGSVTDKFIPNVNNSFHDDEFFFNLNAVDDSVSDESATENNGVISQPINNETHEYYIDDSGRLKWDKLYSACPGSMRVRFKVKKSAGIKFEYQPELTAEEIADGCERPDDIVGSYAVYCNKANNKYKTGKLCHIPRPFVIDASDNREWCVMAYEEISDTEGILYVDMPKLFMQSAVYPVRLDPIIGFSSTPNSSASTSNAAYYITSLYSGTLVAPSSGACDKLYIYVQQTTSCSRGSAIYDGSMNLLASKILSQTWTIGWNEITLDSPIDIVSGNTYHPAMILSSSNKYISYDTTSGNTCYRTETTSFPDPWTDFANSRAYVPAVYLDYTESGNGYYYQQQQM